jgi:hypothetical protein
MRVWTSPILYLGVFLVLAVIAALAAPFVIDWNSYRPAIEAYGERLTGRSVKVNGAVGVRLFPWPRLTLDGVQVGNPEGFADPLFLAAQQIDVRLNLARLINGTIAVEGIDLEQPVVHLVRNRAGELNWFFSPDDGLKDSGVLDHVKLDQISFNNGEVELRDDGRNLAERLTGVMATLSAPGIEGPWKVRGRAAHRVEGFEFTISTAAFKAGQPLQFGARLTPDNLSLPVASFDGGQKGSGVAGRLRLEPRVTEDGKGNAEGNLRPLTFQAMAAADFSSATLSAIRIAPADPKEGGTLIEGDASADYAKGFKARLTLEAPRIDLDALAGAATLNSLRQDEGLALLNQVISALPQDIELQAALKVSALTAGGQVFENASVDLEAAQNAIRIRELSSNLPGRSRMLFDGIVFPGSNGAELGGTLALESNDLRLLSGLLFPAAKPSIDSAWTGSRGRLKAESKVTLAGNRLGFQTLRFEIDGAGGEGQIALRLGETPALDARLDFTKLDLDAYSPQGLAANALGRQALLDRVVRGGAGFETRLTLQVQSLMLNGVEAEDVGLDVESGLRGLDIKTVDIGSVGGARVEASGQVLSGVDGPDGEFAATLKADDPSGMLRLIGLVEPGKTPVWLAALGQSDVNALLTVKPGAKEPQVNLSLKGRSGALTLDGSGRLTSLALPDGPLLEAKASLTAEDSAALLHLMGLPPRGGTAGPGTAEVSWRPAEGGGNTVSLKSVAYGITTGFDGIWSGGRIASGEIKAKASDGRSAAQALGFPLTATAALPLDVAMKITPSGDDRNFTLSGTAGGAALEGAGQLMADGQVTADLSTGRLGIADVMWPVLMPWDGSTLGLETPLALAPPLGLSGEVWVRPASLDLGGGILATEAAIGVAVAPEARSVALSGRDAAGRKIAFDLTVKPDGGQGEVTGYLSLPVDLARILRRADGQPVMAGTALLDGSFSGRGRSPMAVISELSGSGSYRLEEPRLTLVTPASFSQRFSAITDAASLTAALEALLTGPGMALEDTASGGVTMTGGVASLLPVKASSADADVTLTPAIDLAAGVVTLTAGLDLKAAPGLPAMAVTYEGEFSSLLQRADTAKLSAHLGFTILQAGVAELERVQKEQERLIAEEEAQRKLDEEKFAAYQAQRAELRLRQREMRVHDAQREIDAAAEAERLALLIQEADAIDAAEMKRRLLELRVRRGQVKALAPVPIPRQKPPVPQPALPEEIPVGPLILVPPFDPALPAQ